ncbi:MAG TPA: DUF4118 domain-containing protein [Candidatus Sulfotelmatobacter sp.]|nr:DUF4118 domain-containing protein [Candidatus Sulfotelmatobacter sp.]
MRTGSAYGLALAATAVAGLGRWALDPLLGETQPFATLYVAILLVTLWLGWRPAILAAALGFVIGD